MYLHYRSEQVGWERNKDTQKPFTHHGFTVTSVRSSYTLQSTRSFMENFKINVRLNSSMLADTIYSSLMHVIRKCVEMLSVLNIIQVVNPAEPTPAITPDVMHSR